MKSLTEADFEQFKKSNRSVELIQRQYEFLVHWTSLQKEIKAATLCDGIQKLNPEFYLPDTPSQPTNLHVHHRSRSPHGIPERPKFTCGASASS